MSDLIENGDSQALQYQGADGLGFQGMAPGRGWSATPYLTSSDALVLRNAQASNADARDLSRSNAFARSALRNHVDSVIGSQLKLQLNPDYDRLGATADAAGDWIDMVESEWDAFANSDRCYADARRAQTFTDLMRTAYSSYYISGEALGTVEWRRGFSEDRTCVLLLAPERLSDPKGQFDQSGKRRMGVERDRFGAAEAYHIRERHPGDGMWWSQETYKWKRVERFTWWGRQKVLHHFNHDQPDMTRGLTGFLTAALPLRMLSDYARTELESAAVRATYAAVIQSELDVEDAMKIIGPAQADAFRSADGASQGFMSAQFKIMAERSKFYRGQEMRFGKSKVAHLLPNEKLSIVNGNNHVSALKDFQTYTMYETAAGLGVDYASLTKDYTKTSYSGARASLFDVWRAYEAERSLFMARFAMPVFGAWLEERIVLRGTMPMLGAGDFYKMRDAVVRGTFETWGKPNLDPLKEANAAIVLHEAGAGTLKKLCADQGLDWRDVLAQRAREKEYMAKLGLVPEDIDWALIQPPVAPGGAGGKSRGGDSQGDSGGNGGGS